MIKKITLLVALVAFTFNSFAQISFDIKDSSAWSLNTKFDFNLTSNLTNNATSEADSVFEWYVSGLEKPSDWDVTVCSGALCIPNPTGTYEVNIAKSKKMDFKLGFSFYNVTGDGSAWVVARSVSNPLAIDSFRLQIRGGTASVETSAKETFKAYPNPVVDNVTVSFQNGGAHKVMIYDILGSLKTSEVINSGASINLSSLAKGIYVMKLEGDNSFSKVIHKL